MKSRVYACLVLLVLLAVLVAPASALAKSAPPPALSPNAPASGDLIEHPKTWDGQVIPFRGEAIGEAMVRGAYAWLHLNDDAYYVKNVEEGAALGGYNTGMPVWIPASLAREVTIFGDYKHEGDIVEVRGTFNAACAQHGGDMDIHASELRLITAGHHAIDYVRGWKVALAIVLSLLAIVLWQADRRHRAGHIRGVVTRARA